MQEETPKPKRNNMPAELSAISSGVNDKVVEILEEALALAKAGDLQQICLVSRKRGGGYISRGSGGSRFEDAGMYLSLAIETIMAH